MALEKLQNIIQRQIVRISCNSDKAREGRSFQLQSKHLPINKYLYNVQKLLF